ncbi:bpX6 domain-containing protein, partial [Kitasatospora purpeofusca]|uniref:bpX6 domain-containing protein n=1 Tax=Kitasatospora purpeofusca TaxID=67352 RepID=UPI003646C565
MNAPTGSAIGTVLAVGFVLDVPLIGVPEAAERVLDLWRADARLCELPDGRWLLLLPEPVRTRADLAPGLPLERTGAGAPSVANTPGSGPAAVTVDGRLVLTEGGATVVRVVAELPALDPADWLDPTGLALHRPRPVGAAPAPEAPPVEDSVPTAARPDLRAAAGIGPSSERARRLTAEAPSARGRRGRRQPDRPSGGRTGSGAAWRQTARPIALAPRHAVVVVVLLMVVPLLFVVLFGLGLLKNLEVDPGGIVYASIAAALAYGALFGRRAGQDGGGVTAAAGSAPAPASASAPRRARRPWLGDLLARLTLRTPAAHLLHQRHARYLRDLTRAFEQHRWDDALRDALPLADRERGDTAAGRPWFSLALPKRFAGQLRPTPHPVGPAAVNAFSGTTVHQHLTELYRAAAERLERQGRLDEAAFVLADLLAAPAEAVALLERHGRLSQAAELAEGRAMVADLVVRLWWRSGDRARAVRIAHRRGAFATAVARLAATDPQAARELRLAWAEHCRAAGDRLGAVEAVWPDEALRPSVAADLRDAVALGGPVRGRALPHLLALPDLMALGSGTATRARGPPPRGGARGPPPTGRGGVGAPPARRAAPRPRAHR